MNILIPHTWLLEHLETDAGPLEIQRLLSLSGPSVERIYERDGDSVYDIEVTTNRVDMMSVRGIAREAAVILQHAGVPAKLKPLNLPTLSEIKPSGSAKPLPKIFNNEKLNKRTLCLILDSVTDVATPEWMAHRLKQIEMNVHTARIDITNYITHELGHPCHAFDYDKLMATGGEIHIVEATAGETFTTLDGNTFTTVGGEVVFKNGKGEIIDLPSIKGTKNTSVDENTRSILLLMESITPEKVRFASMTHAIRTVAAQLMEKHVDPALMEPVLLLGAKLYQELCGAQIGSEILDDKVSTDSTKKAVRVSYARVEEYLGVSLAKETIQEILEMLECAVETTTTEIIVTPPSFRPDIAIPADVIEEIARIYGYHNLEPQLMATPIPTIRPTDTNFQLESRIKHFLADLGWQEVFTYSMVSEALATESGLAPAEHLKLLNPLTDDRVYLRRSLIPSLSELLAQNTQAPSLSVFEIANSYTPRAIPDELPRQTLQLALVTPRSYRELRGVVETLLAQWFIATPTIQETSTEQTPFSQRAVLLPTGEQSATQPELGMIGVLKNGLSAAVLDVAVLVQLAQSHPTYQPIPKTAPVIESYTFTVAETTKIGEVITTIKAANPIIRSVELSDQFQQNFSFRITYWDYEQPLSNERVEPIRSAVIAAVTTSHQAKLVGEV